MRFPPFSKWLRAVQYGLLKRDGMRRAEQRALLKLFMDPGVTPTP